MKKIIVSALIFLCVFFLTRPIFAASHTSLSLSDAIYADLAVNDYLDNVSLYFTDGKAIDDVRLNETRHWLPASTIKLFVAMYAYKRIAENQLHPTDFVAISDTNEVPTELVTDDLPTLVTGNTVTVDRLIRQMIIQSDNTAFNQLLDILGRDAVTSYVQSLGLTHTHIGSKLNLDESQTQYEYDVPGYGINTTTAEEYATAFTLIKQNKIPGAVALFDVLKQQRINNMIPYFLPKSVICAHKTGDLPPLFHDGGICEDKKHAYVLTIFTNGDDPNVLAHLSEIIYTRNYNLVGQNPDKSPLGEVPPHPIDPLVMASPKTYVLGTATPDFPTPDISAADLGIKASDLNVTIPDNKLPHVFIPADSPLHSLSDAWDITRLLFARDANARLAINVNAAELRVAEAKDLLKRGKTEEAQALFDTIQNGLQTVVKDPTVKSDPVAQTSLQAISETRFTALKNSLQHAQGDERLQVIQQIARQARQTTQEVEPQLPDAVSALNPSQKPLIGTVVSATDTTATIKTSGGQEITIPTNSSTITVKENAGIGLVPIISPTGEALETEASTGAVLPPTPPTLASSLQVGTTVALLGSNKNNMFAPTLIIPNVPRELVAPQPVIVAKVTKDHLVVEENGVYTQVNVNPDTTVKAADTDIPLNQIKPGDVVVVHGEPLVPATSSASLSPTESPTEVSPVHPSSPAIPSTQDVHVSVIPSILPSVAQVFPTGKIVPSVPIPTKQGVPTTVQVPQIAPQGKSTPPTTTPRVINSTSVQVIEQKQNISLPPPSQTKTQPSASTSQPEQKKPEQKNETHSQTPPQPANQAPQQPIVPTSSSGKK